MLVSKLKEAIICFKAGRVTFPYPLKVTPDVLPKEKFRGLPEVDFDKCIGCGGCSNVCAPRLIEIEDREGVRIITRYLERCTYCARCEEICPQEAAKMSGEFETATDDKEDLQIISKFKLVGCENCGEYFTTQRIIDKLRKEVPEKIKVEPEALVWLKLCPDCRRKKAVEGIEVGADGSS